LTATTFGLARSRHAEARRSPTAFTGAERSVWWLVLGLGAGIVALGLLSAASYALDTAGR